jgi:hypothetical protein
MVTRMNMKTKIRVWQWSLTVWIMNHGGINTRNRSNKSWREKHTKKRKKKDQDKLKQTINDDDALLKTRN